MCERGSGWMVSSTMTAIISILAVLWQPVPAMAGVKGTEMTFPASVEPVEFEAAYGVADGAIVCHNGSRFFNRPLYGPNTPALVLAGDRPRLRLIDEWFCNGVFLVGYARDGVAKWLDEFDSITTRFYPGLVRWELSDASFPGVRVFLEAASVADRHGLTARLMTEEAAPGDEVVWAFGGATPLQPGASPNQLWAHDPTLNPGHTEVGFEPASCADNEVEIHGELFSVTPPAGQSGDVPMVTAIGRCSVASRPQVRDAADASSPLALAGSEPASLPVVVGKFPADAAGEGIYWVVTPEEDGPEQAGAALATEAGQLAGIHARAVARVDALTRQIVVDTPDPALDLAVAFSCTAMDGAWYPPVYVHGAMAWNLRYPGWRTLYGPTAYGWHDNVKRNAAYFLESQVRDSPFSEPKADPGMRLALQAADSRYYGNGRIANDQAGYNMQSVLFDMLIHAWRWTGDSGLEAMLRPALDRHLEWQRDCFDPDGNGVYESYINVWGSDTVWYNGGETTQETAYAYTGYRAAAELAERAGDTARAKAYRERAGLIRRNMRDVLWMPDLGYPAEYREALGYRRLMPDTCLYSIFFPIDAGLWTPEESLQALNYTEWGLERVPSPLGGERCWTTNWVPYSWSVRELYPGENWHLALAYCQSGLAEEAWELLKGNYREWMYNFVAPGGLSHHPCGTDFNDISSLFCRLTVEGLFGYVPDMPNGRVVIRPQFPFDWDHASIQTPDFSLDCARDEASVVWRLAMGQAAEVEFRVPVSARSVRSVTVDGAPAHWQSEPGFGRSVVTVRVPETRRAELRVEWEGGTMPHGSNHVQASVNSDIVLRVPEGKVVEVKDPAGALSEMETHGDAIHATVSERAGHRAVMARVETGDLEYWRVFKLEVDDPQGDAERAGQVMAEAPEDARWEPIALGGIMNADVRNVYRQEYLTPRVQTTSAQLGVDGFAPWTWVCWGYSPPELDLTGVEALLDDRGQLLTPQGVPFLWPSADVNIAFTTQYDNYPNSLSVPVGKSARAAWFLVAGTTNSMQTKIANAVLRLYYADGSVDTLELVHPRNYLSLSAGLSPSDGGFQYRFDTDAFCLPDPPPPMVQLGTNCRAMLLNRVLRPGVELKSVELETLSQEVVVGLMGLTIME